ncbi:MAG: putative TetR family transcriptional regulator [Solirubrobacterales bacterium]|nr:putative TetR family transcriptional regulator [Solirubrobacterales bacterium]
MTGAAATVENEEGRVRSSILQATVALLQERTLDELSVAQILDEAGVARATFYHYFASKDDAFVALLSDYLEHYVAEFEAIIGDVARRRVPSSLQAEISSWLDIPPPRQVVIRSAIEEWPRRPEVREVYLVGQRRLAAALAKAITADRRAGVAVPSIPAAQLATGWVWMMERAWYEAVGGATHMGDMPAVRDAVAATLVAAVYGS